MIDERSGAERFNSRRGSDSRVSIQFLSLLSGVAALWFFVSPWSYYGVSLHESAWNDWIVGAVIFSLAALRFMLPTRAVVFSWANSVLGAWILLSPWILGYSGNGERLVNSLAVGLFILAFSVMAARGTGSWNLSELPQRS